jgi:hypothetical protein
MIPAQRLRCRTGTDADQQGQRGQAEPTRPALMPHTMPPASSSRALARYVRGGLLQSWCQRTTGWGSPQSWSWPSPVIVTTPTTPLPHAHQANARLESVAEALERSRLAAPATGSGGAGEDDVDGRGTMAMIEGMGGLDAVTRDAGKMDQVGACARPPPSHACQSARMAMDACLRTRASQGTGRGREDGRPVQQTLASTPACTHAAHAAARAGHGQAGHGHEAHAAEAAGGVRGAAGAPGRG